jgi:hypothetical protein
LPDTTADRVAALAGAAEDGDWVATRVVAARAVAVTVVMIVLRVDVDGAIDDSLLCCPGVIGDVLELVR